VRWKELLRWKRKGIVTALLIAAFMVVAASLLIVRVRYPRNVWFETILIENLSDYQGREPANLVITDENEWERIWGMTFAAAVPPFPAPEVDFSKYMVIAAFYGYTEGTDTAIKIKEVIEEEERVVVMLARYSFILSFPVGPVLPIRSPVHVIKTMKTDKRIVFGIETGESFPIHENRMTWD
jgi:hypothetical protein